MSAARLHDNAGVGSNRSPGDGVGGTRVERTEERILVAARELFIQQGYQDTTLAAVAQRAGVGARTVYLRFGSKGAVLLRAADRALSHQVGGSATEGHTPTPAEHPQVGPAARSSAASSSATRSSTAPSLGSVRPVDPGAPDPIAEFADATGARYEGLGGLVRVLIRASATEPFVADAVERARADARRAAAELVERIQRTLTTGGRARVTGGGEGPEEAAGGMQATGTRDVISAAAGRDAVETVAVLASAEAWLDLTESTGWTARRYRDWLAHTIRVLLGM